MDPHWALLHPREAAAIDICRALGLVETGDISIAPPSIRAYATTALAKYRFIMQKSDQSVPACMRAATTWTYLARLVDKKADDAPRVADFLVLETTLSLVFTESLSVIDDAELVEAWAGLLEAEKKEKIRAAETKRKTLARKACTEATNVLIAVAECGPVALEMLQTAVKLVADTQ